MIDYLFEEERLDLLYTDAFENAMYQFNKSMSDINSAMFIADARIEAMITEGLVDIEPLIESFVSDSLKKIAETFKRFIEWMKTIFIKALEAFKKLFAEKNPNRFNNPSKANQSNGKTYLLNAPKEGPIKHEKETVYKQSHKNEDRTEPKREEKPVIKPKPEEKPVIKPKPEEKPVIKPEPKDFVHTMYPYNDSHPFYATAQMERDIEKLIEEQFNAMSAIVFENQIIEVEHVDVNKILGRPLNEIIKEFIYVSRGKTEQPIEIRNFNQGASPSTMISNNTHIESAEKTYQSFLKLMEMDNKRIDSLFKFAESRVEKMEDDDSKRKFLENTRKIVNNITKLLTALHRIKKANLDMMLEIFQAYDRCLKAYSEFKEANMESVTLYDGGESLLESSIRMI